MIYEYAVSPALFGKTEAVALLHDKFGIEAGRLISDYPRREWAQIARAVINRQYATNDSERRRISEALIALVKRAIYERQGTAWERDKSWIHNAQVEHQRRSFHGIVCEEPQATLPHMIGIGYNMGSHAKWPTPASKYVQRAAKEMVEAVAPLLDVSTSVALVDQYFDPTKQRFLRFLGALAQHLANSAARPKTTHITYVTSWQEFDHTAAQKEANCRLLIKDILPTGMSVGFILIYPGRLHDRFVLSERGGVSFGKGLDTGAGNVLVQRLSEGPYSEEWQKVKRYKETTNLDVFRKFQVTREE